MELHEFAEQVLFGTTLEEKLQCPGVITDERPGLPIVTPEAPGRPAELRFKPQSKRKADFPGTSRLEQEHERGRLLHFFANHELLATELMALVLLKFPDTPRPFRRGVLQTLKDEQEHARLYMRRMRECGIQFGELPVSGYFWRAVSGMESPLDYVAGLSLTFEQANLDFARHFGLGFETVGDSDSARLLDRIYHDEIGHVAYGLKWFRLWKNPHESDWEAFRHQLKFPLSPQRAKGRTLNLEGRRAAGLDPQFIAELNVYSQSKGRTPNVFVFNPFAEGRLAQGKAFMPVKHQAQLAADLANLPQYLSREGDVVLVEKRPSVQFLSELKLAGFPLPEFVELKDGRIPPGSGLQNRKLGCLRPWARGPDSLELLEPLFGNVTLESANTGAFYNEAIGRLYSKSWSADFLARFLRSFSEAELEPWLCSADVVGVTVRSLAEALDAIKTIRARGYHKVVLKEALGLAGHNALRLWEPELLEAQRRWLAAAIESGSQIVVEPWLEREGDFSAQLEMAPAGLKLCGYTGLLNDRKGQYLGNWTAANYARRIPLQITSGFREPSDVADRVHRLFENMFLMLQDELQQAGYTGPVGIDAFVYRASGGELRLKPVVEINPRYTMGRVTVELMKRTCPGCHGRFRLINRAQLRGEGFEDFGAYARELEKQFPLRLEGEPEPRLSQGAICLNEPGQAQVCLATFQVSRSADGLTASAAQDKAIL